MRLMTVARLFIQLLIVLLQAGLAVWVLCAPLIWILRDGFGPDSIETGLGMGLYKTLMIWGIPALTLAVPLYGLLQLERWMARKV